MANIPVKTDAIGREKSKLGLNIEDAGPDNQISSNTIVNATEKAIDIEDASATTSNIFDKTRW